MRAWEAVAREPWAITEDGLATILSIAGRDAKEDVEAVAAKMGRPLQNSRNVTVREGVATIPVTGPIFRYANLFTELSGATSLGILALDIAQAVGDPAVKAVILKYDTPGGQASGVGELADQIRAANKVKPVVAYVDNMAASAGYWLAAASPRIVMAKTASVGSIGVIGTVISDKPKEGSGTYQFISSQSPHKRIDPETEQGAARLQAHIDGLAAIFIDSVAGFRGVTPQDVIAKFGGGAVLLAQAAVAVGMATETGDYETLHKELATNAVRSPNPGGYARSPQHSAEERAMSDQTLEERCTAEWNGNPALRAEFVNNLNTYIAYTRGQERSQASTRRRPAAPTVSNAGITSQPPHMPVVTSGEPLEQRCRAQWNANPALRAEFGDQFGAYVAYTRADEAGMVRIIKKRG